MAQKIIKTLFPFTPGESTPFIRWLRPDGLPDVDGNNAIFARGANTIDNRWSFKIDHLIGTTDRLAFRYSFSPVTGTRSDWGGFDDPSDPIVQDAFNSRNLSLIHSHTFTPRLFNEARLSYSRGDGLRSANDAALSRDWSKELGLVPAITGIGFPALLTRGINAQGGINGRSLDVNFGFGDDLSWIHGRHSLKMGVEHRRIQLNRYDYGGMNGGTYSFAGQTSPNTGTIQGILDQIGGLITGSLNSFVYRTAPTVAYYRWHYLAGYLQDDFKLNPHLTLNVGLRWDVETPRMEKYDNQGSFDPALKGTVNGKQVDGAYVFSGTNNLHRTLWPMNYTGFQPRLGLAWSPHSKMVWRASYNIIRTPLTGVAPRSIRISTCRRTLSRPPRGRAVSSRVRSI